MKLILVRHGESTANAKGIIQGQGAYRLSNKGTKQSKKLAERLKNINFKAIFSSDLVRTEETTKIITKFHKKTPVYFSKLLREKDVGELQGKNRKNLEKNKMQRPNGGETYYEVKQRANKFLNNLLRDYSKGTFLVVSHGRFIKMFLSVICRQSIRQWVYSPSFKATCVNEIEVLSNKTFKILRKNCVKHLG